MTTEIEKLQAQIDAIRKAQKPGAVKMVTNTFAVVGSTADSDKIEARIGELMAKGDTATFADAVKQAAGELGFETAEHDIPEGSTGPIVLIDSERFGKKADKADAAPADTADAAPAAAKKSTTKKVG